MTISKKNLLIIIAVTVSIVIAIFLYQKHSHSVIVDDLEKINNEMVGKYKEEKLRSIDSLKSLQEDTVNDLNKEIGSLIEYNNVLTNKIRNYGKNPKFDDYDFLERAKHVSEYKYKSGE